MKLRLLRLGLLGAVSEGNVYICLLTQDPGEPGAITNEATFTGYTRIVVPRGATGWTEAGGQARNYDNVNFPECTGGSETITHFGVCKTLTGDDMILHGELDSPALVSSGVQLQFTANQLTINID